MILFSLCYNHFHKEYLHDLHIQKDLLLQNKFQRASESMVAGNDCRALHFDLSKEWLCTNKDH